MAQDVSGDVLRDASVLQECGHGLAVGVEDKLWTHAQALLEPPKSLPYTRYSYRYVPDELIAWAAGRGIWSGDFTAPEDWRRQRRR